MEYELMHWGVKGMQWGVRRYQSKDGSLTPAGKKRYYKEADKAGYKNTDANTGSRYKTTKKGKVENYEANADKWVKDDLTRTRKLADESSRMTGSLKNIADKSIKSNPVKKMDLSSMSDKQMRDEINRAMLERQYNEMFAPRKSTKGREFASKFLETAGDVLVVTSTALGIALAVKELRG